MLTLLLAATTLAQAAPQFEAASVRRHVGYTNGMGSLNGRGSLKVTSPQIQLDGYTLYGLLLCAYGLRDYQLSLGNTIRPEDVLDTLYDVRAKAPGESIPAVNDVRAMLRDLLGERFELKLRTETKEMPVYSLTSKKPLTLSKGLGECILSERPAADGRNREMTFTHCPIERLTHKLQLLLDDHRPVIDNTGLTGAYDFSIVAIPEYARRTSSESSDVSAISAVLDLGLKLEARKSPIEVLIVEHVSKLKEN